ncbi:MAG: hypothetical protein NUV98_06770, partial [Candidatus Roizmanbacteria bacterium]|nr:hypothetical protein [Candidatus Roizmanbacteria bacterium]
MKIEQRRWEQSSGWLEPLSGKLEEIPQLVFVFGGSALVSTPQTFETLKQLYPSSHILLCSTAGEILNTTVTDNSLVATAVYFSKTSLQFSQTEISQAEESYDSGKKLAKQLPTQDLV